ncbi:MAG: phytanoyl-CoA dioxygenase family protein [Planctomycetota bacterium]
MLRRLMRRVAQGRRQSGYHSRFGGLWTDRLDVETELERRRAAGCFTDEEAERLRSWIRDGYVVLLGAVDHAVIDAVLADVERAWSGQVDGLIAELGGVQEPVGPHARKRHTKLLDLHVVSEAARRAIFAPPLLRFLELVCESEPVAFQSLAFDNGSGQPIHQDTAYVVVTPPLAFLASWIALEDIRPGSGELAYYVGSHRLPEHVFASGLRNWNRKRDGDGANAAYLDDLVRRSEAAGLERRTFLPRKGDVLLWANDLAHGGSTVTDPDATRRSLVTHYCPQDAQPYYTSYRPQQRWRRRAGQGGWISSSYYGEPGL